MDEVDERIVWTGRNHDEVELLARDGGFGFVVGSPFHNERWWHRAWNWLWARLPLGMRWEWVPPEDMSVLEIYLPSMIDPAEVHEPAHWTTARSGDEIDRHGRVYRSPHD